MNVGNDNSSRNELLNGQPSYWQGEIEDDNDDDEPIADFQPKNSASREPTVDDLRKQQTRILDDQNEGLETLSKVISRQKHLALRIGDEFDEQNGLFLFGACSFKIEVLRSYNGNDELLSNTFRHH